jgi:hypothetical protein
MVAGMSWNREWMLIGGVAALFALALVLSHCPAPSQAQQFQEAVGGLGFGPARDLSDCAAGFDPRIEETCDWDHGFLEAGTSLCRCQGISVFRHRPLAEPGP